MEQATISNLVTRRNYSELEKQADEYIENDDWNKFLMHIQSTTSKGKARDALEEQKNPPKKKIRSTSYDQTYFS